MSSDVRKVDVSPYGRTLKQYSVDEKISIINYAKSNGNRAAGREFNVAESSIREWRKNEVKLINSKNVTTGLTSRKNNIVINNNQYNSDNNNQFIRQSQNSNAKMIDTFNKAEKDMMRLQLAQIANNALANINTDIAHHLTPLLQLQHNTAPIFPSFGVTSIPVSSASPPPPPLLPTAVPTVGSGRRKIKYPQKIVVLERNEE